MIRKSQFLCVEVTKIREKFRFVNFERIASICVGFILVHCMATFFKAKFEFPAQISNKTSYKNCLNLQVLWKIVHQM